MLPSKRPKYGNKKIEVDGVKFDSKLEYYLYNALQVNKMDFDFQVGVELVPKFRFHNEGIRAITMRVDFLLRYNAREIFIDTKGFATTDAKMKYKMLKYKFKDNHKIHIIWLKTQKEVNNFIFKLKQEEQL